MQSSDRQLIATTVGALWIANKSDLPPAWMAGQAGLNAEEVVTISAQCGDGIDALVAAVTERLVPDPPLPGAPVPFRDAHVDALVKARGDLLDGEGAAAAFRLKALIHG